MCINFYIQHRIFKRRRIDCHTADGVTTTALASRRRAVVGAVDRPLARPDRPDPERVARRRMRRRGRPATGDASDDQRRTTEETFTKTERHQQTPPPRRPPSVAVRPVYLYARVRADDPRSRRR